MTRTRVAGTVDRLVVLALNDEVSRVQKKDVLEGRFASSYSGVLQLILEKGLGLESSENRKKDVETVADGSHFDVDINFESFGVEIKKRVRYERPQARANLVYRSFPIWFPRNVAVTLRLKEGGYFEIAARRITLAEYNEKYRVSKYEERVCSDEL